MTQINLSAPKNTESDQDADADLKHFRSIHPENIV